jgi:hypothetical protein
MTTYAEFLAARAQRHTGDGFEPTCPAGTGWHHRRRDLIQEATPC